MTTWRALAGETSELYSPVGLRLLDELTAKAPIGKTDVYLDILEPNATWRLTDIQAVKTPTGVVTYPGLERHTHVTGLSSRSYRVRLSPEFYVPLYRRKDEGIAFKAFPYNDTHPPQVITRFAQDTFLTPAPNYPFAGHVPVLRGVVVDTADKVVPDAVVTQGAKETVLTDSRGTFALPVRWVPPQVPTPIDAVDERTGRVGSINIQLPDALGKNQKITIS